MADRSGVVKLADAVSELLYGIVGWLSIGVGVLAALTVLLQLPQSDLTAGTALLAMLWLTVAFVLVVLGVFVNPRFRRRLNRRHEPSQFGRLRSVDRRVVRPKEDCDERCVSCRSSIGKGLVRRYREEYVLAGVPVYTRSEGYNHYCLDCATDELSGGTPSAPDDDTGPDRARSSTPNRREPSLERE
ncbi:hypothetical protein [Natronorubrum halalkaliphilum]|uniref:hypothetical protein n=1 Tax=Natronorubrum halalkaliphilum TaxID=2691917 RepID=UPI001916C423|nr:hypothetical protein [Natronorubrum halalkaliphilum]